MSQQTIEYQQPSKREFERGSASTTKARPKPKPQRVGFGPDQNSILESLAHKSVEIVGIDGRSYSGILLSSDQYTLGLVGPGGDSLMLYKSGVLAVRAKGE